MDVNYLKNIYLKNDEDIELILNNPNYILELIDKYYYNYVFMSIIKICYSVSLIHNNYSSHIISLLVNYIHHSIDIIYKNNKIYINYDFEEFSLEKEIRKMFINVNKNIELYIY